MMKNRFLFVAMLFAALSLGFVSCDDNKGNEPDDLTEGEGGSSSSVSGIENGHKWVDLGLSVKWATCNVGATKPEEYGKYFAWGETTPKTTYNWRTYKWCTVTYYIEFWELDDITKYCTDSDYGAVDNNIILDFSDDAVSINMGGNWRMPSKSEQDELRTECTWTWIIYNGIHGYNVEGPNGNSIFLPAAGYCDDSDLCNAGSGGYYWSSSLFTNASDYACDFHFYSDDVDWHFSHRCFGRSVRGVIE